MVKIGSQHRLPLLPVRRSTGMGYVGRLSNWSGTPRCLEELQGWVRVEPERKWWFSHIVAAGIGAMVAIAWMTR